MIRIDALALMFLAGALTGIGLALLAFSTPDVVEAVRNIRLRSFRRQRGGRFEDNPFGP